MSTAVRVKQNTFDEFCTLLPPKQKADLIDGVIYLAAPEPLCISQLSGWLLSLVYSFVQRNSLGEVYYSRVAFRLGQCDAPEPDIAFVSKKRLTLCRRNYIDGSPDLAVEVVSPESHQRDYFSKRLQYQVARVPEYMIIDKSAQRATLLRLNHRHEYQRVRLTNGKLQSAVMPGFWLRPAWLWQPRLPTISEVLAEIAG